MTDKKQGYCRFCGQAIYDATAATQTEADVKATRECDCSEAERYRAKMKVWLGEASAVGLGEASAVWLGEASAVEALAKSAGEKDADRNIRSLSINCDEAIIKITENAKDNIVRQITKSKTAKVTLDE